MITITEIKRANRDAGFYFFSRDTMRCFGSRVYSTIVMHGDVPYFLTSEREPSSNVLRYSIRCARPDGKIDTVVHWKYSTKSEALAECERMLTRDDCIVAEYRDEFYHRTVKNADGSAVRCRVNGQCKTWKTRPDDFRLPVKYGLKQCFYITPDNVGEWTRATS